MIWGWPVSERVSDQTCQYIDRDPIGWGSLNKMERDSMMPL